LHDVIADEPDRIGDILRSVLSAVEAGRLAALPVRSFRDGAVHTALHAVERAGHVGVVVLSREPPAPPTPPRCTALLTGAFGGLGPHLIDRLCDAGADRLVLADLHAPSGRALDAVARARGRVRSVEIATLDVTDRDVVRTLIRKLDADAEMPP